MEKFKNNRILTIEDLKQSGIYEIQLLQDLIIGKFEKLSKLPIEDRSDINYMEPLLFAVKNELNTYKVYKYYSERLQNNDKLGKEIIKREPELIENSPLGRNAQFIIENVENNPKLIQYIIPELKTNEKFIIELSRTKNKEVLSQIVENCEISEALLKKPELNNNQTFISSIINKNVEFLKFASDELKNNFEFLKEEASNNEQIIDYVVNNIQNFGLEGIKGVRESSREFTISDCINLIDEMAENSTDDRYAKVKSKIQEKGMDDIHAVSWVTAMVAQRDDISSEIVKKVLNYSILTMEKTKQDLTADNKMQINLNNMQELITPLILNRLKVKLENQGIKIDDNLQQRLEQYTEFYKGYQLQFQEQKKRLRQEKITIEQIRKTTQDVNLKDIEQEIGVIKGRIQHKDDQERES